MLELVCIARLVIAKLLINSHVASSHAFLAHKPTEQDQLEAVGSRSQRNDAACMFCASAIAVQS